jgi:hypothetical protein
MLFAFFKQRDDLIKMKTAALLLKERFLKNFVFGIFDRQPSESRTHLQDYWDKPG